MAMETAMVLSCGLAEKYATAPYTVRRRTDFRPDLLVCLGAVDIARNHRLASQAVRRYFQSPRSGLS